MHINNNPSDNRLENIKIWTQSENTKQCILEWRWKQFSMKGEKHNMAKFTETQIIEIRKLSSEWISYRKLSAIYNMSKTNIADIIHRRIWQHI
jgi:hypothetical protein